MNLTNVITDPRERTRFLKFAVVGTIGAVVDFGFFNLLSGFFGVQHVWASVLSFTAAIISNFTWNRLWSFPESRARPLRTQLPQFALVNLIGLGINQVVFLGPSASLEEGDLILRRASRLDAFSGYPVRT